MTRAGADIALRAPGRILFALFGATLFLSGCGGGGGHGSAGRTNLPEVATTLPNAGQGDAGSEDGAQAIPTPEDFAEHPAFDNQWGLGAIGADNAFARVARAFGASTAPGRGVTLGFIDTGIDADHPYFRGRPASIQESLDYRRNSNGDIRSESIANGGASHGTIVASVATANRDRALQNSIHGIAWGADVKMLAIPLGTGSSSPYRSVSYASLRARDVASAQQYGHEFLDDVDILNLSFGTRGLIEEYSESGLRANYANTIAALAQADAEEKTILVWSAGNQNDDPCEWEQTHRDYHPYCRRIRNPDSTSPEPWVGQIDASSPSIYSGLMAHIPELRGHSIAVAAVGRDGEISDFSNRCGVAADWCIAAPGEDMQGARSGPQRDAEGNSVLFTWRQSRQTRVGGTSVAAPMVSGSLAVMKHLFRDQLSHTQLVERLFVTADKTGRYADRAIYGQGMLDLDAATRPFGEAMIATGAVAGAAGGVSLRATGLRLGGAFGNGLNLSLAGNQVVAFDQLDHPFWYDLGGLVETRASAPPLGARINRLLAPRESTARDTFHTPGLNRAGRVGSTPGAFQLGYLETVSHAYPGAPPASVLAHAGQAAALTWREPRGHFAATFFATPPEDMDGRGGGGYPLSNGDAHSRVSGAVLAWRAGGIAGGAGGGRPLGLRAGWLAEHDALLGSSASGAFGRLHTDTVFAGFEAELGTFRHDWRFFADGEIGLSRPRPQGGFFADLPPLTASAFALRAERELDDGGWLHVSLAQPLRIESDAGGATLEFHSLDPNPDPDARMAMEQTRVNANLTPSGRQLDARIRWDRPLGSPGAELRFGATWSRHPGHDASASPDLVLLGGVRYSF